MTKQEIIYLTVETISKYLDDIVDSDYKITLIRENTALNICNRLINKINTKE